jgi:Domain of unknown function (DUF4279)
MKAPKPSPPIDVPAGTVQLGGSINWFKITLRILGEDLVPEEITAMMGREPDDAHQKGKPLYRRDGSFMRVPKSGGWRAILLPESTDEWSCGEAMLELLATVPSDLQVWHALAEKYTVELFVGLKMPDSNREFYLSPRILAYLGERKIGVGFDIYHESESEANKSLQPTGPSARG